MADQRQHAIRALTLAGSLAVCFSGFAQFRPPYRRADALPQTQQVAAGQQQPHSENTPPRQPATATAPPATSVNTVPTLLNEPAQPPTVTFDGGKLTVDAHNSTLSEILNRISSSGGMKISGLRSGKADQRVFGRYGPGDPRTVLSELLDGSGYNVLMLGTTPAGTPRELSLSVRPSGGVPNPPPQNEASMREEYEAEQARPTEYAPAPRPVPEVPRQPQGARQGIRTPQQILQELEQMRQQEQQQQQSAQQN